MLACNIKLSCNIDTWNAKNSDCYWMKQAQFFLPNKLLMQFH